MKPRLAIGFALCLCARVVSASEVPQLSITNEPGAVVLTWPAAAADWVLEQSANLQKPIPWVRLSTDQYQSNATSRFVRLATSEGSRFFRLRWSGPPVPGLTGTWSLDEGTGQVSADNLGAAPALFFTNAMWVAGRIGPGALRFDGGGQAWVSNTNFRVLPPAGQPFSISTWFSPDSLAVGRSCLLGNANLSNGWFVALDNPGPGTNLLIFASLGVGASLSVTGRTLLLPGQWHELAVAHDGSQGSIYLDGVLLARGMGSLATHDGPVYFGGGVAGFAGFSGRVDDIRTYTNALSQEQISLAGHWRFNEAGGCFVTDSSIHGQHGYITNAVARVSGKDGLGIELSVSPVIIPNDDYGVSPPTGEPFSLSFWLRPHALPVGRSGLMSCTDGTNKGWSLVVEMGSPGPLRLRFGATNSGGTLDLWAPLALTNETWTKLDLTDNGGIATVYVNGQKVLSDTGAFQGSRAPLVIGAAPGAANFNGVIDDLKIYRRERDAAEIGPVAADFWGFVFLNSTTNLVLPGTGPAGKTLTFSLLPTPAPTNGTTTNIAGAPIVTYRAGAQKGPDLFAYTVNDGEFTSAPARVWLSVVQPHWLSPTGGVTAPLDGSRPEQAWAAGTANAMDDILRTNNYYDCFLYAPGEYQTHGYKWGQRSTVYPGCKHIGAGAAGPNATTVKLVDVWESSTEEFIFGSATPDTPCGDFEIHQMKLDCNAANVPKYALGEPVWVRIPLTSTAHVASVTLRWDDSIVPGFPYNWRIGRAADFTLCARRFATNTYVTNCTSLTGTGQVDVVTVNADAEELLLQLTRRPAGVDFYGLTEIEIVGAAVSLPTATALPGGGESRLDPQHSALLLADVEDGTWWASGTEPQVQIVLPFAPGTAITWIDLYWNCQSNAATGQLGPAASYLFRARDQSTGQFFDVPFVRYPRTGGGYEPNTFRTAQNPDGIVTDQLLLLLNDREPAVDHYSLREIAAWNGAATVPIRVPTALNRLASGGRFPALRAFDRDAATQWASETQGMVGAILAYGSNMKFTNLKIVGFGSKAGRECFPVWVKTHRIPSNPAQPGNVLIEDCVLTDPATNNNIGVTALTLAENPPDGRLSSVVRRCTVTGLQPWFYPVQPFSAAQVEYCLAENCQTAVYFEPDPNSARLFGPVLIRSNLFLNVDSGVRVLFYPGVASDSLTCLGNEIVLTGRGSLGIGACDTCNGGPSGTFRNLTALYNVIRYADWTLQPTNRDYGLFCSDIRHAVFGNNVIVQGTTNELRVRHYPVGLVYPSSPAQQCGQPPPPPPGQPYDIPALDPTPPGYRRAWFNNWNLAGALLPVRTTDFDVERPAAQQQWPASVGP